MMGHADISSTQVYVQLLGSHVKQVYNHCHPKAKLGIKNIARFVEVELVLWLFSEFLEITISLVQV